MAVGNAAGRPHAERLRSDLDEIRAELVKTVRGLAPDELDWSPRPDLKMRSFRQLLQEIGAMEQLTLHMARHGQEKDWEAAWNAIAGDDIGALLACLESVRAETLAYLDACTEETLQTPVALAPEWQGYFHAPAVEPEELMRWIARHEYYHLGQMVTYQWQRGNESVLDG